MGIFGSKKEITMNSGNLNLYTIYDRVAEDSCSPFVAKNDGVALRSLAILLKDVELTKRDEYKLYKLGSYDPISMEIIQNLHPIEVLEVNNVE